MRIINQMIRGKLVLRESLLANGRFRKVSFLFVSVRFFAFSLFDAFI
jgi:hypothetical protein